MAEQRTTDQPEEQPRTVTIDGREYPLDQLSESARTQAGNLRVTDQEIQRLQQQLAIAQTARLAYANELKAELDKFNATST